MKSSAIALVSCVATAIVCFVILVNAAAPTAARTRQWEYKIIPATELFEPLLNQIGAQGWELCVVDRNGAVFKRPSKQ